MAGETEEVLGAVLVEEGAALWVGGRQSGQGDRPSEPRSQCPGWSGRRVKEEVSATWPHTALECVPDPYASTAVSGTGRATAIYSLVLLLVSICWKVREYM